MAGRCDWIPLQMEYLAAARDNTKATGDKKTLSLLREISRLHYVLLKTHQVVDFVRTEPGDSTLQRVKELRAILDREPLIIRRRQLFNRPIVNSEERFAMLKKMDR